MQYKQENNRFYVVLSDNTEIAEMTFTRINQDKASIDYTFVEPSYRGKSIAEKLLTLVVDTLEKENRQIIPLCSFAVKKMRQSIIK